MGFQLSVFRIGSNENLIFCKQLLVLRRKNLGSKIFCFFFGYSINGNGNKILVREKILNNILAHYKPHFLGFR